MVEIDPSTQIGIDGERHPIGDLPVEAELTEDELFEGGLLNWADYFSEEDETHVTGVGITSIESITQAAYDALTPPVSTTLYVING